MKDLFNKVPLKFFKEVYLFFIECVVFIYRVVRRAFIKSKDVISAFCNGCKESGNSFTRLFFASAVFSFFGGIAWAWFEYVSSHYPKPEEVTLEITGQFGDSFGVLTSLFAGMSVILIYMTLSAQRKELELTRDQIRYQQLENSLFQMFNSLDEIVSSINMAVTSSSSVSPSFKKIAGAKKQVEGRSSFYYVAEVFKELYLDKIRQIKLSGSLQSQSETYKSKYLSKEGMVNHDKVIRDIYSIMWKEIRAGYSHYFRYLYRILKVIDESGLDEGQKESLSRVVRAQLSDYELLIIFYNCYSPYGTNLVPYVKRYEILDNLTKDLLIKDTNHYVLLKEFRKKEEA